jgi:hypothetical protein
VRRYYGHRRAYAPRMWPTILLACGLAVGLVYALGWHGWDAGLVGGGVGLVVVRARWSWWKHQHPVIPHDQYIEDMRRAAPWN